MINYLVQRWRAEGGYREFLVIAFPLILSTAAWSVQHFVDRMFLTWYSTEAMAAALPGGMTNFVFASFFIGVASYVNTFVAQYNGAGRRRRVGPALWQGGYLAVISAAAAGILILLAQPIFDLIGHEASIREQEVTYFSILCFGHPPLILATALSCFYSGRGRTWMVFNVNVAATAVNIVLDYGLIFGKWGLPAWGIRGAAWATNLAEVFAALVFLRTAVAGKVPARVRHPFRLALRPRPVRPPAAVRRAQRRQLHVRHDVVRPLHPHRGPRRDSRAHRDKTSPSTSTPWPSCRS